MTTPAAAALYEAQHNLAMEGKRYAVYNPHDKPVDELPVIYGFNNGGSPYWLQAVAIAQDGTVLGGHACSAESYMLHDLGILEGTRADRHTDQYQQHYPDGYRMDFVASVDVDTHKGLQAALAAHKALDPTTAENRHGT